MDLQDLVFEAIKRGFDTNAQIRIALGYDPKANSSRVIDTALQKLRKANRIRMAGVPRRWHVGGVRKPCPTCQGTGKI